MKRLFLILMVSCSMVMQGVLAQSPWQDAVPQDPNVIVGKLENGITYYIRHNEEPKGRASFYIIRNAGALLETEEQNGLAHFLEHMSFQGTKNFPGKAIISSMEKYGLAFGRNINAYTAHNETVYNISSVPTESESLLDSCVLMLHDWSYYLSLEESEIDAERGVIAEEWRTRRTPDFRIKSQFFPVLFKGSMYAVRDVIGSLDVINHFDYQTIREFYHKWYRTDLEAVAICGDFDVKKMEDRVKRILSKVPAVDNPKPRPFFEIPYHEEMYYSLATDKEVQSSTIDLTTVFRGPTAEQKNTHVYMKENLLISLYNNMASARINEIMRQANPPFMAGSLGYNGLVRGYEAYSIKTVAKPNKEALAFESILKENKRILDHGFTASELERAKMYLMGGVASSYQAKNQVSNDSYVNLMKAHFLDDEPMIPIDYYYGFVRAVLPSITVEEVNALAKKWNVKGNRTVMVSGPTEGVYHLTETEVKEIMAKVERASIEPYKDAVGNGVLFSEELKGGKVVQTKLVPELQATEWTLDNGAKVVFRKADYEKGDVALYGYSEGGTSLFKNIEMLPAASEVSGFVRAFGLGDYDAVTLDKILTGKMAFCDVSINSTSETVNGGCIPKDFEIMMQLLYMKFEHPRFDQKMYESIMSNQRMMVSAAQKDPQKMMQDSVQLIMSGHHPRVQLFGEKYLDQMTLEKMEQAYRDRIQDASDFTFFIVGDIDENKVKHLVEKYIGSINSSYRREQMVDNQVSQPKGKVVRDIYIPLETSKSTVIATFKKKMPYTMYNILCSEVLRGILEKRYIENVREKEGGTYGVSVATSNEVKPVSFYTMTMSFECDPDKADYLKSLIYLEIEKLKKTAPTQEELKKVVSNVLKNRELSKPHNKFWMHAVRTYYITGINIVDPQKYEEVLEKMSPKDIQKFTKAMFKDADLVDITFRS